MVFQDKCHDCTNPSPSLQMMIGDKDSSMVFSLLMPCSDMVGNLFVMCQQGISVFVSMRKNIRVSRAFR